jgi:uncharacterized protein
MKSKNKNKMFYIRILLYIIGFLIAFSILDFYMTIRPPRFNTDINPGNLGLKYSNISFKTEDNINIRGWFVNSLNDSDKTIIVCHGYPFDKNNILSATYFLAQEFNILYFDFRYFGESEWKYTSVGYYENKDLFAAVEWLKENNHTKIGAMGFSLGASTILMKSNPDIQVIVADSPYANLKLMLNHKYKIFWIIRKPLILLVRFYTAVFLRINLNDVSPLLEISNINTPILLIHGEKDTQIPVIHSKLLYEESNKNTTELWIDLNSDHGHVQRLNPVKYRNKIIDFFNQNIK